MDELTNTRLYTDVCSIIEQGRKEAYASVNHKMIETHDRATEAMAKTRKEFHQKKQMNV